MYVPMPKIVHASSLQSLNISSLRSLVCINPYFMYVWVYVCMYSIYVCMLSVHACVRVRVPSPLSMLVRMFMYSCVYVHVCVCVYAYMHAYIFFTGYGSLLSNVRLEKDYCVHVCIHTYIHTYIHTHICIHSLQVTKEKDLCCRTSRMRRDVL
jgi:hypothetical protein